MTNNFDQEYLERIIIRFLILESKKGFVSLEKLLTRVDKEWFTNEILASFIDYMNEKLKVELAIDIEQFIVDYQGNNINARLLFDKIRETKPTSSFDSYLNLLYLNYQKMYTSKRILEVNSKIVNGEVLDITSEVFSVYQDVSSKTRTLDIPYLENNFISDLEKEFVEENMGLGRAKTGLDTFDKEYSGFKRGDLIIVGARPSMGKTSLLITMAVGALMANANDPVVIFSAEMPPKDLRKKIISVYSYLKDPLNFIPLETMMRFINYEQYRDKIIEIDQEIINKFGKRLIIIDTIGKDIDFVREELINIKKEHGRINMAFLDYLQILKLPGKKKRHEEISDVSLASKTIARTLDIPFAVLTQLNRELEQREDKRPIPSDLRDSGAIEQDADMILFIHREDVYNKDLVNNEISETELIMAKNRNGPTGTVMVQFHKKTTAFIKRTQTINIVANNNSTNSNYDQDKGIPKVSNIPLETVINKTDVLKTIENGPKIVQKNLMGELE